MWGDTLVPCNDIYKHRDQRLGTNAVTQCVNVVYKKNEKPSVSFMAMGFPGTSTRNKYMYKAWTKNVYTYYCVQG